MQTRKLLNGYLNTRFQLSCCTLEVHLSTKKNKQTKKSSCTWNLKGGIGTAQCVNATSRKWFSKHKVHVIKHFVPNPASSEQGRSEHKSSLFSTTKTNTVIVEHIQDSRVSATLITADFITLQNVTHRCCLLLGECVSCEDCGKCTPGSEASWPWEDGVVW